MRFAFGLAEYIGIRIEAERVGKPPELPLPNKSFKDKNGITHTQIGDAEVSSSAPQLSADSRKLIYATRMDICYALSRPPKVGEPVPVGAVPYRASNLQDQSRQLPTEIFVAPENILA